MIGEGPDFEVAIARECATAPWPDAGSRFGIIYSSGTTGKPKGIVHSHAARMAMAQATAKDLRFPDNGRALILTPPHSNGTLICLLPAVLVGGALVLAERFDPRQIITLIGRQRVTHAFMVPTMLQQIVDVLPAGSNELDSIQTLVSAGAPLAPPLKARLVAMFGDRFAELWGLTEGVASLIRGSEMVVRPDSVGRPLSGTALRIAGDEPTGEIIGRSPYLMTGYQGRADEGWADEAGERWLRTGDIGEIDEAGYLRLRGRMKDMIISGGLNIYPQDIEAELCRHPAVRDAAVVGVPDPHWGETPIGFVETSQAVEMEVLLQWANERLARHQKLRRILAVDRFPRNALGKPLKDELKASHVDR